VRLVTPQSIFFLTTNIRIKVSNSIYPVLTASSEIVSLDKIDLLEEKTKFCLLGKIRLVKGAYM
jgi:hypothetical protein